MREMEKILSIPQKFNIKSERSPLISCKVVLEGFRREFDATVPGTAGNLVKIYYETPTIYEITCCN